MKTEYRHKSLVALCARSKEFAAIIDQDQRQPAYEVEPELAYLQRHEWEGMITIRFEAKGWKSNAEFDRSRREHFVRALMNNLRAKWKLRDNDIYWVSSTEYGASGAAHCHLIFNFPHLRNKGIESPQLSDFESFLEESVSYICGELKVPKRSLDFKWSPKYDNFGLVAYVCKKEPRRDYKDFDWSTEGLMEWVDELLEDIDGKENPL